MVHTRFYKESLIGNFKKTPYNRTNRCTQVIATLMVYDIEPYKGVQVVQA